ncbi:hypothetical protein MMC12_006647 [Toensbergia leucococca]|nr:hypothetical protein [Toensbergia leucococca]
MDIIWSCFSVILLCTWTVQHLSLPARRPHKKHRYRWIDDSLELVRSNATKLKWMALTVMFPEYILAKALTEHVAARDSWKQFQKFGVEGWTSTHAYFANMRGFVLRFDVAAVKTSLEPVEPDEDGRKLQIPSPDGDSPYHKQDAEQAISIELDHCRKICGPHCPYRIEMATVDERKLSSSPPSSPRTLSAQQPSNMEHGEMVVNVERHSGVVVMETTEGLSTPRDSRDQREEHPAGASPSTLVSGLELQHHNTLNGTLIATDHTLPNASISSNEKPILLPHEIWKGAWALSSTQLLYAYQNGIISMPPSITVEELNDRSKGDALVKGFAVLQITWLIVQIGARAYQNLAITLLEITALALAACAMVIYILLWHKPQDVQTPTYIDASNVLTRENVIGLAARSPVSTLGVRGFYLHGVAVRVMADSIFPWPRGIAISLPRSKAPIILNAIFIGIGVGGVLFGSIHFVAWNFEFPTPVERLLWRTSCSVLVILPLFNVLMYCITQHAGEGPGTRFLRPLGYLSGPLYFLARIFLLVEVFRSLAYSPPSSFEDVNWPSAIPHVN